MPPKGGGAPEAFDVGDNQQDEHEHGENDLASKDVSKRQRTPPGCSL